MLLPPSAVVTSDMLEIPAMNPATGAQDWTVEIERVMLEHLERRGPTWKFYNVNLLPEALEEPDVVFHRLNRVGFDDAYCFSVNPSCYWIDDQARRPAQPGTVFVVYVSVPQRRVLDWEFRVAHKSKAGAPKNCETDFGRQVWPPIN